MRLAQAARKLSITTEDIVDFLEIRGVVIEKDSNTKLDEKVVKLLYKHFEIEEEDEVEVKGSINESESEVADDEDIEETEVVTESTEPELEKEESLDHAEAEELSEEKLDKPEEQSEQTEKSSGTSYKTVNELLEGDSEDAKGDFIIKAPKMELKGLNVVGKIDLPEPKPKPKREEKESTELKSAKTGSKKSERRTPIRKQKRELSPSEIRKREEQKEARKREQAEREKKKKREKFYKEKILKPKQIEQKSKPGKKRKSAVEPISREQKPVPKSLLGKFWRWLNT